MGEMEREGGRGAAGDNLESAAPAYVRGGNGTFGSGREEAGGIEAGGGGGGAEGQREVTLSGFLAHRRVHVRAGDGWQGAPLEMAGAAHGVQDDGFGDGLLSQVW